MPGTVCDKYLCLLRRHVAGEIDHPHFERDFLRLMKEEQHHFPLELYLVLQRLFGVVESFCADPTLRDAGDADEVALSRATREALDKLEEFQGSACG